MDRVIHDNEKGTYILIDVAILGDRNVIKIETEKIWKYKDLTIGIQCMWNEQTKVIPIIIGVTRTISKSFRKYLSNNQESTKLRKQKNHTGHCSRTSEGTTVKVQNIRHWK
jgi:hypothetical protein